ncbi:MAG TPA: flagellar M-ring protein FliF C-terminal domain-containing protein [Tepidisphaeraceae bacterium]|nr:flagellar M-ring protein FliF C-terminal domain-containing protein [Tepidisphaeraceae bacterium]
MDFVKTQLDRIQQQLAGLNASQKMLVACLVTIIVLTVMWWGRYAGTPERAPLFQAALTPEETSRVRTFLAARGYDVEVAGDNKVTVPAAKAPAAIADLTLAELLPKNRKIDFETMLKSVTPFTPESMNKATLLNYKNSLLAEIIGKMDGVRDASVVIDTEHVVRIGGGVKPSAAVHVQLDDGVQPTQKMVQAIANLVLGAAAAVERDRIQVVINQQHWPVRDPKDALSAGGGDILELVQKHEAWVRDRLERHLNIPGASVYLTLKPNTQNKQSQKRSYDKDNVVQAEKRAKERTSESTVPSGPAGEPGAIPNGPLSLSPLPGAAGGGDATTSESESETDFEVRVGEEIVTVHSPAGEVQILKASVRIPRSYITWVLKGGKADAPEPVEKEIQAHFNSLKPGMLTEIKTCAALASDTDVSLGMFYDFPPPGAATARLAGPGGAAAGATSSTLASLLTTHSREVVLGGLAVVSLFMVSMMVRRSGPVAAGVSGVASVGAFQMPTPVLDATETLAGEVGEGKSMLDAMELDEDAVRAQQMLDQVEAMVEDNPDAAAGLVKRWLSRT